MNTDRKSNEMIRIRLAKEIGSFTRFEELETEKGICFPIHFVVCVSLKLSSCTQIKVEYS